MIFSASQAFVAHSQYPPPHALRCSGWELAAATGSGRGQLVELVTCYFSVKGTFKVFALISEGMAILLCMLYSTQKDHAPKQGASSIHSHQ